MGKLLIGLIIGLIVGAGGALFFGGGALMGTGIATGLSAGMCSTISAAVDAGLMSEAQADEIMAVAAEKIAGLAEGEAGEVIGTVANCEDVLQKIRDAAA